jgi:hypothetical protein
MSAGTGGQSAVVISWVAACMGKRGNAHSVSVGIPEGVKPFNRSWRRWKYNIKMYFK